MRLSVPPEGIRTGEVILRFPSLADVDAILPAFTDPTLREAGNLPAFDRDGLVASLQDLPTLAERGRLLALAAVDAGSGEPSQPQPARRPTVAPTPPPAVAPSPPPALGNPQTVMWRSSTWNVRTSGCAAQ